MLQQHYIKGIILVYLFAFTVSPGWSQSQHPPNRIYDEAQTVYLGNLTRREHGLPPLRWNRELTYAARWFARDSLDNRSEPYCGHQDSQGGWPGDRAGTAGYNGVAGAENVFCGYVTPEQAIAGWLQSPGHAENLLHAGHREIGLGYYPGDKRGYVVQMFGYDPVYPPAIIENEALTTSSPHVTLYIYSNAESGTITGIGAAVDMMIANTPSFEGSVWEPYTTEKPWRLTPGEGWKTVYVKTRDRFNRTVTVSDTIYLGSDVPYEELGDAHMSTARPDVTISHIDSSGLPLMQFSPGWLVDDSFETFELLWGNGEQVHDVAAEGGTAFRLRPGNGESRTWVWTTNFITDVPLVAYFRLKLNATNTPGEVARISITGGGTDYGPISLHSTDFVQPQQYQEFALPFTFDPKEDANFLMFNIWRSNDADIFVDTVSIFTAPQPVTRVVTWPFPGRNYRGQGIWMRFTDGTGTFSPMQEAVVHSFPLLTTNPEPLEARAFLPLIIWQ